jgi:hypothetical protein
MDRPTGNRRLRTVKKSAEGIVGIDTSQQIELEVSPNTEGLNLLTKESIRRCVKAKSSRKERVGFK